MPTAVLVSWWCSSTGPAALPSARLNAWSCCKAAISSLSSAFVLLSATVSSPLVVPCSGPLPSAMPAANATQMATKAKM